MTYFTYVNVTVFDWWKYLFEKWQSKDHFSRYGDSHDKDQDDCDNKHKLVSQPSYLYPKESYLYHKDRYTDQAACLY